MTFPANPTLEAAPYGPQPVLPLTGPQGGPYDPPGPRVVPALPSASRVATATSAVVVNSGHRGVLIRFKVSVNPGGAQTLALSLIAVDPLGVADTQIMVVPASATPGGDFLLYPGLSGAAVEQILQTRNLVLPQRVYVIVIHSAAGAWTYGVTLELLP